MARSDAIEPTAHLRSTIGIEMVNSHIRPQCGALGQRRSSKRRGEFVYSPAMGYSGFIDLVAGGYANPPLHTAVRRSSSIASRADMPIRPTHSGSSLTHCSAP